LFVLRTLVEGQERVLKGAIVSETFRLFTLTLVLACLPLAAGCGKGGSKATSKTELSAQSESTSATVAAAETTVAPSEPKYKTTDDPKAVYGMSDLPGRGSYLKLDFNGLTSDQLNRVIHRMRTENCTCGCMGDPIDQCLVNDPSCTTAVTLANQIIREEKMKG
jgi:hypothetical protein